MSIPIAECDLWVLKLALGSCATDDGAECLDATCAHFVASCINSAHLETSNTLATS